MLKNAPTTRSVYYFTRCLLLFLLLAASSSAHAQVQGLLESPEQGSFESGIGLIRGWVCEAGRVEISIDGGSLLLIAYGTARADTRGVCGDDNNGFGFTFNWNTLGDGLHNLRAFADGIEFANVNFVVTTLGESFLRGASGTYTVLDFPSQGDRVTIRWSEPHQNFVFARAADIPAVPNPPSNPRAFLESPSQGSAESGIGLIRGWVCEAQRVEISIDGSSLLLIAYGTARADTRGVCGDDNNGFGFTFNWNSLGDGSHNLRAFADGIEFANVNFAVTVLRDNDPFLTDLSHEQTFPDFPRPGNNITVRWSQPHQNFVIAATGSRIASVAAITDVLNPYIVAALGNNNSDSIGVQGTGFKGQPGQARRLTAITYSDLNSNLVVNMPLGNDGLPMRYSDSNGIKAEFSNFTQTSVDVRILDSTNTLISSLTLPINGSLISALRQLALSVQNSASLQASQQGIRRVVLTAAAAAPVSLDPVRLDAVFLGGVALGELVCALSGNNIPIAATACGARLTNDLANLATAGSGNAPEVQQALRFTEDVTDAPCNTTLDEGTGCLTEAARDVRENIDPSPPGPVPAAPTGVNASDGNFTDRIRITWNSVTGATFYQVFRSNSGTTTGIPVSSPISNSFDDTSAEAVSGDTFSYRVSACNNAGCSPPSDADSGFAGQTQIISAPTGVTASDGTFSNRVEIIWNPVNGATSYEVFRSEDGVTAIRLGTTTTTGFADTSAVPGVTYFYLVTACNSAGCSNFSNADTGFVLADVFRLTVTKNGMGSVVSSPAGIDCGSTCQADFPGGTLVTLTPTPLQGWAFVGWNGACTNSTGNCVVTMNQARSVTANFVIIEGQQGEVRVSLIWGNDADLDLYVTDPCENTISFSNRSAACQGTTGTLDVDANVDTPVPNPQENIFWPMGIPAPEGSYQVGVCYFPSRDVGSTTYQVITQVGGIQNTFTGTIRFDTCQQVTTFNNGSGLTALGN